MKATGIVRRIDDLGRVVIPKEIRKTLRIRDGDPLEIFTEKDGQVIFKKYSPMEGIGDFAPNICDAIYKTVGICAAICDRDTVIAASGISKKELVGRKISAQLENILAGRNVYSHSGDGKTVPLSGEAEKYKLICAVPVISQGDILGAVTCFSPEPSVPDECTVHMLKTFSTFLSREFE